MKRAVLTLMLFCTFASVHAEGITDAYPILAIPRSASPNALLKYRLNSEEQKLFKEIDTATSRLPINANLSALHEVAIQVGRKYGLNSRQSVAFFTRTTFSEFEP